MRQLAYESGRGNADIDIECAYQSSMHRRQKWVMSYCKDYIPLINTSPPFRMTNCLTPLTREFRFPIPPVIPIARNGCPNKTPEEHLPSYCADHRDLRNNRVYERRLPRFAIIHVYGCYCAAISRGSPWLAKRGMLSSET